jgi:isopentenyldiphosphate isomerase
MAGGDPTNEPEELIDLVDESDRVIGTVRKGEANRDPSLRHREVAVLIHRGDRLLWQQRSWAKEVMPGVWDVACAGHVRAGASPEQSAHRELSEELGFDTRLVFVERRLVQLPNETHFAYVYWGAAAPDVRPQRNVDEVEAIEWCDRRGYERWRAEGRVLAPVARRLAEDFWASRGRPGDDATGPQDPLGPSR